MAAKDAAQQQERAALVRHQHELFLAWVEGLSACGSFSARHRLLHDVPQHADYRYGHGGACLVRDSSRRTWIIDEFAAVRPISAHESGLVLHESIVHDLLLTGKQPDWLAEYRQRRGLE